MIQSPVFVPVPALAVCAALRINPCEESFLFFARHPVAMTLALLALILVIQPGVNGTFENWNLSFSDRPPTPAF